MKDIRESAAKAIGLCDLKQKRFKFYKIYEHFVCGTQNIPEKLYICKVVVSIYVAVPAGD